LVTRWLATQLQLGRGRPDARPQRRRWIIRAMSDDQASRLSRDERSIPPRDIDPAGSADGVDDHRVTPHPHGIGHQPTGGLDDAAEREHLTPSWQGVKVEPTPDPDRATPPARGDAGR
jgi:hypothetical protein